jgi:hypothetical protein
MDREETEYTGRPDVIVLEVSNGESQRHLITEVKYSNRKETIREGVREAHTYSIPQRQINEPGGPLRERRARDRRPGYRRFEGP